MHPQWLLGYRAGYNDHAASNLHTYQIYGIRNGGKTMDELFDMIADKPCPRCGRSLDAEVCGWCDVPATDDRKGRHRVNDRATSVEGAQAVAYRAGSQKATLLETFKSHYPLGYTDEEAATVAGLGKSCYWKRVGELRQDGAVLETGVTRPGSAGVQRIVCVWNPSYSGRRPNARTADVVPDVRPECPECGTTTCSRRPGWPYCYGGGTGAHSVCGTCGGFNGKHEALCSRGLR